MLESDNEILKCNKIKVPNIYSFICLTLSIFCIVGSLLFVVKDVDFEPNKVNLLNSVWADEINGTENSDNITGTINQDTIRGFDGNDIISGLEGGDDISGGSGDDIIYGNEGRDVLKGKGGNDHIEGGEGNDRIYGDRGNDVLVGGPGNDTLTGGIGKDIFICGTGTDTVTDFNVTQQDAIPENDCENIKYGNTDSKSLPTEKQQEQQASSIPGNINGKAIIDNTNITTEKTNPGNGGGFFGLFK